MTQKVMIEAGVQASLVVPMGAAQPGAVSSGWFSVTAPRSWNCERTAAFSARAASIASCWRPESTTSSWSTSWSAIRETAYRQVASGRVAA